VVTFRAREPVSGYTHLAGLALGLVGGVVLLARAHDTLGFVAVLAYAASLVALYAASSAYHLLPSGEALRRRLRQIDHSAIFVYIAGTCTPVFVRALEGRTRAWMLGGVWTLAIVGIVARVAWMDAPRWLYVAMYVAMGWFVVVDGRELALALPASALAFVVAGGLTYTMGAVVYATKRPDPLPSVFGFHEIWHLFVMGGSAMHYAAVFVLC
jgi:hemolysin III